MIFKTAPITNAQLPGIEVFLLIGESVRGQRQQVLVVAAPMATIPLHRHNGNATMFPVSGEASLLSEDEHNGTLVRVGDRVEFARLRNHGFRAGPKGFSFISINEGIVDHTGDWDIRFC